MSDAGKSSRAADLARAFDSSFANPVRTVGDDCDDFLAIRTGGDSYAVRLRDVVGLTADRKIVPLPTSQPALLGIAGLRGGVVPVYSLATLLGSSAPSGEAPRWMLLVGAGALLGFAFDQFDGQVRVPRSDVSSGGETTTYESARIGDAWRGIADVVALAETIRARLPENETNHGKEK
jgi:purine-binding chemotaxis protein CheW